MLTATLLYSKTIIKGQKASFHVTFSWMAQVLFLLWKTKRPPSQMHTLSDNMPALKSTLNHVLLKGYEILVKFKRGTWASWIARNKNGNIYWEIKEASPTFCYFLEYESDIIKLIFNTNSKKVIFFLCKNTYWLVSKLIYLFGQKARQKDKSILDHLRWLKQGQASQDCLRWSTVRE